MASSAEEDTAAAAGEAVAASPAAAVWLAAGNGDDSAADDRRARMVIDILFTITPPPRGRVGHYQMTLFLKPRCNLWRCQETETRSQQVWSCPSAPEPRLVSDSYQLGDGAVSGCRDRHARILGAHFISPRFVLLFIGEENCNREEHPRECSGPAKRLQDLRRKGLLG